MPYLLDANDFIQAKNLHYGFDFCPAFWDWIDDANAHSRVFSINRVADELAGGADDLTTWAAERPPQLFLPGVGSSSAPVRLALGPPVLGGSSGRGS